MYQVTWNPSPGSRPVNGPTRWVETFDVREDAVAFKATLPAETKPKLEFAVLKEGARHD
jgi:hypothetical protein